MYVRVSRARARFPRTMAWPGRLPCRWRDPCLSYTPAGVPEAKGLNSYGHHGLPCGATPTPRRPFVCLFPLQDTKSEGCAPSRVKRSCGPSSRPGGCAVPLEKGGSKGREGERARGKGHLGLLRCEEPLGRGGSQVHAQLSGSTSLRPGATRRPITQQCPPLEEKGKRAWPGGRRQAHSFVFSARLVKPGVSGLLPAALGRGPPNRGMSKRGGEEENDTQSPIFIGVLFCPGRGVEG